MNEDRRMWILDPAGHRAEWAEKLPEDGTIITDGPFAGAEHIVLPPPDDPNDWVCDYCNTTILTRWGDEPFPVPMDGSNALCADHYERIQNNPYDDEVGGPWPAQMCGCAACFSQAGKWLPMLDRAYGLNSQGEVVTQT